MKVQQEKTEKIFLLEVRTAWISVMYAYFSFSSNLFIVSRQCKIFIFSVLNNRKDEILVETALLLCAIRALELEVCVASMSLSCFTFQRWNFLLLMFHLGLYFISIWGRNNDSEPCKPRLALFFASPTLRLAFDKPLTAYLQVTVTVAKK